MNQDLTAVSSGWWQRLDHRKLSTLLLVALCGLYGPMIANLLPSFVTAWIRQLNISERAAGDIATINLLAHACGLTLSLYLVSRWPLPRILRFGLALAVLGDGVSIFATDVHTLEILRAVAGLGLGLQFGAILNWFGRNENSVRGFGMFITLQFVYAAGCFFAIPSLSPILGAASVYALLVPLALSAAFLAPILNLNGGSRPLAINSLRAVPRKAPIASLLVARVLSILAFALFNIAAIGLWGYMERYGMALGLSGQAVAAALAMSALSGVPGGFAVVVLGSKFGRMAPLLGGLVVFALPIAAFALATVKLPVYFLGVAFTGFAWNIVQPYLQDIQSSLDKTGRLPVLGMLVAAIAGAFGPALVGLLVADQNYRIAFAIAVGILTTSGLIAILPAIVADRHQRQALMAPAQMLDVALASELIAINVDRSPTSPQ
jgi:MFS family permease